MPRVRFIAPASDPRPGKEGTVYGAGHETDYDPDDYDYIKTLLLDGKAELLDGPPVAPPPEDGARQAKKA